MKTHCPHCKTRYDIDSSRLQQSSGNLVCGHCRQLFNAFATSGDARSEGATVASSTPMNDDIPEDMQQLKAQEVPPEFLAHYLPEKKASSKLLGAFNLILLTLFLIAQATWLYRVPLLENPRLRDWANRVCAHLDCRLPEDPRAFRLTQHRLQNLPEQPHGYRLQARIHNHSEHSAQLPALELQLFDSQQKLLARRTFGPTIYADGQRKLAPGKTHNVVLELVYSGKPFSGYELHLIPTRS